MSNTTLNPALPRWMRHANCDLPNPTPAEVQADKESRTNRSEAEKDAEFEAIMNHYAKMAGHDSWEDQALSGIGGGIDWQRIHALIPWFAVIGAVVMWATFILIPTAFGLHYTGLFPATSNWLYVLTGLVLCLACFVAARVQHGARAILFAFAVLLLSYWF
jgi:hypothetical protein